MIALCLAPTAAVASRAVADRERVERILREAGVARELPDPPLSVYFQDVLRAFAEWILGGLRRLGRSLAQEAALEPLVAGLVAAIAVLLLVFLVLRVARRSTRDERRPAAAEAPVLGPPPPTDPSRDRERWRLELERRLSRREIAGALEALWWYLARSLAGGRVDPSWTSRELLLSAGREDLIPFVDALDRMTYGTVHPGPEEVRLLFGRIEGALP